MRFPLITYGQRRRSWGGGGKHIVLPPETIKFNLKILLNIHNFHSCGALWAQNLISQMCALSAPKILTFLTFAPPPPQSEKLIDDPAYGMALYTRHYTDKTLKLREIYECASEL